MNWQNYIHSNPNILVGKLVIKETRISIEFLLNLFANGWSEAEILENYPSLTSESIRAVFSFTAECMRDEFLYMAIPLSEAS
ncbi:DUF433 domain-containing protein [Picosynechococcus sp. NKBG15041c]|uniref:DUF433 domain-containing protein n=1 Tax=Picosynechococcus sp. NKBG15041c TaxID=1407650 RepID=UPI000466B8D0|nr:DUF433 domain-containing protein [Picosynechococcus sp. NKBG15041c]